MAGSFFTGWSSGACINQYSCTVTMDADQNLTATFAPARTLTVSLAGTGSQSRKRAPFSRCSDSRSRPDSEY
jgi:hypothetical protein